MQSPIPAYLARVVSQVQADVGGAVADYIPELATADPEHTALAIALPDGHRYLAGDADVAFSIQSMSKPFTYGLAITDNGLPAVLDKVGVEPSGEAFNEISLDASGRPRNPMINAGAIATHSLVHGADSAQRFERLRRLYSACAGRDLSVDERVYTSEAATGHRNIAMGHLLRSVNIIDCDPVDIIDGYFRQCSVEVTVADLAMMAATLANGGVQPLTGEAILDRHAVRQMLSVMTTCGMYDAAGDWLSVVGIPAKSGVAGGIIGVLPGQIGIAAFSPRLDRHGNSVRGVAMFERLSDDLGMHLMELPPAHRTAIRSIEIVDDVEVVELQGALQFTNAEIIVRELVDNTSHPAPVVALDIRRVHSVTDVARRLIMLLLRGFVDDGKRVAVIDPDGVVGGLGLGDGIVAQRWIELPHNR
ncbi:glutaminase [Gordonia sp. TBRC 11910]|uniref:Glutaminase n=1 Tax=Gordonia asplenii TaxID=2725283 RepID=A0A848KPB7_9ACTN|nr:glutaminase [Gordonia asplenii]NMN99766.1 glutaminase [Gordonia asplenii]